MFLLRSRAPERYGRWREGYVAHRAHPDGAAIMLERAIARLTADNLADEAGRPRILRPPLKPVFLADDPAEQAAIEEAAEEARRRQEQADALARDEAFNATLRRMTARRGGDYDEDVA